MTSRPIIRDRLTSVAAQFVHAIIPREENETARLALYKHFNLNSEECVYCGDPATDVDHFRSIVKSGRPSGYFHTTDNLVPSCGPCNQSKGGQDWNAWMRGSAKKSPATREIANLRDRIERLQNFADNFVTSAMSQDEMRDAVGPELWDSYWEHLSAIETTMKKAQQEADKIRPLLEKAFLDRKKTQTETIQQTGVVAAPTRD